MGLYACLCTIDAEKLDLFGALRGEHYAFLIAQQHRIRFGGPARVAEGGRPETMIIIVEASDQADAESWIASEPYNVHAGFSTVLVRPWSQVLPETEPGLLARTSEEEARKRASGG